MSSAEDEGDIDIDALAEKARDLGITTRSQIVNELMAMIQENADYLEYRKNAGRRTSHNRVVARNSTILALAIRFLEGKEGEDHV
jgi:hypothetical protein